MKTNRASAKKYQKILEETIRIYHEKRKHLSNEEASEVQEQTSEEIIKNVIEQALKILREMLADRDNFRKMGLSFEEKSFYDIPMMLRDKFNINKRDH